ncbi:unnamed protein product [Pleuronectes platessa]|uniref:Uncharacterized protein n=1 Tax=Pleuronectes platessa TaxID=8262 RepID=A0A9N7UAT3_PLEPL|nr:unnamed protein product [Pleuronectes platessa]
MWHKYSTDRKSSHERTKCSGDASLHPASLCALASDAAIGKRQGLIMGCFQSADAFGVIATPLKKLELAEMCPWEPRQLPADDNPHPGLTQLQLQTQPSRCQGADEQLLQFGVCKRKPPTPGRARPSASFGLVWQKAQINATIALVWKTMVQSSSLCFRCWSSCYTCTLKTSRRGGP